MTIVIGFPIIIQTAWKQGLKMAKGAAIRIREITPSWFIGKGNGVAFFGRSRDEVSLKHWNYMRNQPKPKLITIVAAQTAEKLIQLERQILC